MARWKRSIAFYVRFATSLAFVTRNIALSLNNGQPFGEERDKGVVTLDETPIGNFFELEGTPDWIDKTATLLGFERGAYVLASYGRLYLDHCAANGLEPTNMVFS